MSKFANWLILALKGAAVGIADAVPGVSGGTIAFILKIYDRLLDAIALHPKKLIKNLPFLIPLGIGVAAGVFCASKVLGFLFENHNVPTQMFFMGIIIGSLPTVYKECHSAGKFRPVHIIPFVLAFAGIILFNSLKEGSASAGDSPVAIILMTAAAAAAMIMPGLSGALVLKILGGYEGAITAVSELDIAALIFYAIGAAIGLLAAAKIISILLAKCKTGTYCAIIGLIVGSIPAIYPKGFSFGNAEGIISAVIFIAGIALPLAMEFIGKRIEEKKAAAGAE